MHCAKLKNDLLKKAVFTTRRAKKLAKKRGEMGEKQRAMERAREVLSKVAEKDRFRTTRSNALGEAEVHPMIAPRAKDAVFWLRALRTNDPEWQRQEERKLRHIQRTDPDWRRHQDNVQGDGGYSWQKRKTRMSYSLLTKLPPVDPYVLAQLGESKPNEPAEAVDEDQSAVLQREAELEEWLATERKKITQHRAHLNDQLQNWRNTQTKQIKRLTAKGNHIAFCTQQRNVMQKHLAKVVVGLPLPDHEKTQNEKPLLADMEIWLKCERCKKPKALPAAPKGT
jgi:hypothetical protein